MYTTNEPIISVKRFYTSEKVSEKVEQYLIDYAKNQLSPTNMPYLMAYLCVASVTLENLPDTQYFDEVLTVYREVRDDLEKMMRNASASYKPNRHEKQMFEFLDRAQPVLLGMQKKSKVKQDFYSDELELGRDLYRLANACLKIMGRDYKSYAEKADYKAGLMAVLLKK